MYLRMALAIGLLALHAVAAEVAEPLAMIGFHEGTKRIVECKGGILTGVEIGFVEDAWAFSEGFIGSMRFICSNKTVTVQYVGDMEDTAVFGRLDLKTVRKGECEGNLGVAGFKWRAAGIKNPDGAEMRQAGLVLLCNRPGNAPSELVLEIGADGASKSHNQEFSCKQVAKYAGLPAPRVTKAYVWYNRKSFAGLEPIECA